MYYQNWEAEQCIANEQTIANMIKIVESPVFSGALSAREKDLMVESIKLHLIAMAKLIVDDKYLKEVVMGPTISGK